MSEWTVDAALAHITAILDEREKQTAERFRALEAIVDRADEAASMAIIKSETATNHRFESVNEFRLTLADQAARFVTRSELDLHTAQKADLMTALSDRIAAVERTAAAITEVNTARHTGSITLIAVGGLVISGLAVAVTVLIAVMAR